MTQKKLWLTDLGQDLEMVANDGEPPRTIGRYGVWQEGIRHPECIDTSADLGELLTKYNLPPETPVYPVGRMGTGPQLAANIIADLKRKENT